MRYKNIIWDMDGTLLNTLDDLTDCVNAALSKYGLPKRTTAETRLFVGKGLRHMFNCSAPANLDSDKADEIFEFFKDYYSTHSHIKTAPYSGICEILEKLHADGFKMAIVSNKVDGALKDLAREFFGESIDFVIGDQPGLARKPAPDMVNKALEALGADKSNSVYIGDSDVDLATAQNSALPCISVLWGFRTEDELAAKGADTFCRTPDELYEYLIG